MNVINIQILRWMCGHTRLEKTSYDHRVKIAHIDDKIRGSCLRWFHCIVCKPPYVLQSRCSTMMIEGAKRGGRPKII